MFNTSMFIISMYYAAYTMVKFDPYDDVRDNFWSTDLILTLVLAVELVLRILAWIQRYGDIWGLFISWEMMIDVMVFLLCSVSLYLILYSFLKDTEDQSIFFVCRGFREFSRVIRAISWFRIMFGSLSTQRWRQEKYSESQFEDLEMDRSHIMISERFRSSNQQSSGMFSSFFNVSDKKSTSTNNDGLRNPINSGGKEEITLIYTGQVQDSSEVVGSVCEFRIKPVSEHNSSRAVEQKNSNEEKSISEKIVIY